ncbi:MAG: TraB domain-containing protein, partial [Desulfobacteraceae bacterium]|nr:TraB domain-containing protein [Desulfobacteraceae bacterium]
MGIANNDDNIHRLYFEDKEIILLGTAHVSRESANLVDSVIEEEKPDCVCVELCQSRYQTIRQKDKWQKMDIIKVIKDKKAFLLLSNHLLASFQKRIAKKFNLKAGEEMIKAIEKGEEIGAKIHLADRDIHITLSRTWRIMGLWDKLKLLFQFTLSLGGVDEISEEEIEKMKQQDVLQLILADIEKSLPVLRNILIDERDQYLAYNIKTAPGKKIVAVVGAGHVSGIKKYWNAEIDLKALEEIPPKSLASRLFKWVIPFGILLLFIVGFFWGGYDTGAHMITWWVMA